MDYLLIMLKQINLQIRAFDILPVSQSRPVYPDLHKQVNKASLSMQVAPFKQGFLSHTLTSLSQSTPVKLLKHVHMNSALSVSIQ